MNTYQPKLWHDNFQNYKRYGVPKAQLVIADIPYNIGANAYGRERVYNLVNKVCDYSIKAIDKITELKQENKELKSKIQKLKGKCEELEKTERLRQYAFVSYNGKPLKVFEVVNADENEAMQKNVSTQLKVSLGSTGYGVVGSKNLFDKFKENSATFFELLVGNETRSFYVSSVNTGFLVLTEIKRKEQSNA